MANETLAVEFLLNRVEVGVSNGNVIAVTVLTLRVVFIPSLLQTVVQIISYTNVESSTLKTKTS